MNKRGAMRLAIVKSTFNEFITSKLLSGALTRLSEHGVSGSQVNTFIVPGAIEIPLVAQILAKSKRYDAIICLGAVIRGKTSHYDYVCEQVSAGCQRVMMDYEIPVIFGVLTTDNDEQAEQRVGGRHGHKGIEAADAAISMVNLINQLKSDQT